MALSRKELRSICDRTKTAEILCKNCSQNQQKYCLTVPKEEATK